MPTSISKISHKDIEGAMINAPIAPELTSIIVIPAFAENSLVPVLESLAANPGIFNTTEVIILFNESDSVETEHAHINEQAVLELEQKEFDSLTIHVVFIKDIPQKKAGVGLARKMAMDEAVLRLKQSGPLYAGIIVNLDADCTVSPNYISAIQTFFKTYDEYELANIHWEHDLMSCATNEELEAIIAYELHLRYFIGMQRYLRLPYAFQTMGSAFAVRAAAYQQVGGMNKRKAGEDFYFIHKFTKKNTAVDLNDCMVYPSGRKSFRVPFGTGKAVNDLVREKETMKTYHPQSFYHLIPLVANIPSLYQSSDEIKNLPEPVCIYLKEQGFDDVLDKLRRNSKTEHTFRKAFFQWFDAFRLMKYLHFARDHYHNNITVMKALNDTKEIWETVEKDSSRWWLDHLRKRHRSGQFRQYDSKDEGQ